MIAQHLVMFKMADHAVSGSFYSASSAHGFNVIVSMAMTGIRYCSTIAI